MGVKATFRDCFIWLIVLGFLPASCFTNEQGAVNYDEAFLRMVTPKQAEMVREYFETRGLSNNLSPRIKIVTTYKRRFDTDQTLSLTISGKKQDFSLSYDLVAFILKPDADKSIIANLKEYFPFFAQDRLATLCAFHTFLRTDHRILEDLYIYGVPVKTPERLKGFSQVLLTSDLYWIHAPEEPENHLKQCQAVYPQMIEDAASRALPDIQANAAFPGPEAACRSPDPRNRIRDSELLHHGDPDCLPWYQSLNIPGKEMALPRCLSQHSVANSPGTCALRARSATGIVLFRDNEGNLSTRAEGNGFSVISNPARISFFCDETVGASLLLNETGSWFRYYSAGCYNPG